MLKNALRSKRIIYMAAGAVVMTAATLWMMADLGATPELNRHWAIFLTGPLMSGAILGLGVSVVFHGSPKLRGNPTTEDLK